MHSYCPLHTVVQAAGWPGERGILSLSDPTPDIFFLPHVKLYLTQLGCPMALAVQYHPTWMGMRVAGG